MDQKIVTVPVTGLLLDLLAGVESQLADHKDAGAAINDREYYRPAVVQLEKLVRAIAVAQASMSLLVPTTSMARFRIDPGGTVSDVIAKVLGYLANDAAELLGDDGTTLSNYESHHTKYAYGLTDKLFNVLSSSIRYTAVSDMTRIGNAGIANLVSTATILARVASGQSQVTDDDGPELLPGESLDGAYHR